MDEISSRLVCREALFVSLDRPPNGLALTREPRKRVQSSSGLLVHGSSGAAPVSRHVINLCFRDQSVTAKGRTDGEFGAVQCSPDRS